MNKSVKVPFTPPQTEDGLCKYAFIGEAPGANEVEQMQGYVGAAGKLLDQMLDKADIDRSECLVGNVFRYRPTNNKIMEFFASKKIAEEQELDIRTDLPTFNNQYVLSSYAKELNHIRKMLKRHRPKIVFATGNTPLWALAHGSKITQCHGQIMECKVWPKCVVMPIYHPSYVMRDRNTRIDEVVADLERAKKLAKKPRKKLLQKVA